MSDYKISTVSSFIQKDLEELGFSDFVETIEAKTVELLCTDSHGDFSRWESALTNSPEIQDVKLDVTQSAISIQGTVDNMDLEDQLKKLIPWRKGPFQVGDVYVDTEWRSDFKWDRLQQSIDLQGKRVLDVGCGNGYHRWRMLEKRPKWVLGVDPNVLFNLQFRFIYQYSNRDDIAVVPLGIEQLPKEMHCFDTVFSMGVLYHRKSPIDHLYDLKSLLVKGGELILETLIVEGDANTVLVPQGRYAKMRNVWFLPSIDALEGWLKKVGFQQVKVIDVSVTSLQEQRSTEWMLFDSLETYLDKDDLNKTVEGHPAPKRVVISAKSI